MSKAAAYHYSQAWTPLDEPDLHDTFNPACTCNPTATTVEGQPYLHHYPMLDALQRQALIDQTNAIREMTAVLTEVKALLADARAARGATQ